MRGIRIFLFLFGLPFAGVGVGAYGAVLWMVSQYFAMQGWVEVPAQVTGFRFESYKHRKSRSNYKPVATYAYSFNGNNYNGDRVSLLEWSDNIGSYQQDVGGFIEAAWQSKRAIPIYVDPSNPSKSVINRSIRYEVLVFFTLFALTFGVIGLALVLGALFAAMPEEGGDRIENSRLESNSGAAFILLYAGILFLILAGFSPIAVMKGQYFALLAAALLLSGMYYIARETVRCLIRIKRFGRIHFDILALEPGSLRGKVVSDRNLLGESVSVEGRLKVIRKGRGDDSDSRLYEEKKNFHGIPGPVATVPVNFSVPRDIPLPEEASDVQWELDVKSVDSGRLFRAAFPIKARSERKKV